MTSAFVLKNAGKGRFTGNLSRYVQLQGVPTTALPSDLRRMCVREKIADHVSAIDIDYHNLEPTGTAWLTLADSVITSHVVNRFDSGIYVGASRLVAKPDPQSGTRFMNRGRGQDGRAEGAERGVIGSGPSGRISAASRSVALSGLPEYFTEEGVKELLRSFKFARAEQDAPEVVKLARLAGRSSKFIIRLESVSEAHRLVRKLHQTPYVPPTPYGQGTGRTIKARIIH